MAPATFLNDSHSVGVAASDACGLSPRNVLFRLPVDRRVHVARAIVVLDDVSPPADHAGACGACRKGDDRRFCGIGRLLNRRLGRRDGRCVRIASGQPGREGENKEGRTTTPNRSNHTNLPNRRDADFIFVIDLVKSALFRARGKIVPLRGRCINQMDITIGCNKVAILSPTSLVSAPL